jgi:UBX domain-containing protein 1
MMAYGRPAASFSKPPPKKTGLATLSSLGGNDEEEDDDDDDDDDYDETRQPRDLFAGGEKSGLAVQDPAQGASSGNKKLIQDILSQARS